ncbi:MAG: hypothetical protein ACYC9S_09730 [Leptospirales bacterium]
MGKKLLAEMVGQVLGFVVAVLLLFWMFLGVGSGRWFGPWGFGG